MKQYLNHRAARLALALGTLGSASAIAIAATSGVASASGSLTNVTLTLSNNASNGSATGAPATAANTATYTVSFVDPDTTSIQAIVFSVPVGTTAPSSAPTPLVYGLSGCGAATFNTNDFSSATGSVEIDFATACSVPTASSPVEIQVPGLINTATATTTAFKTTVNTYASSSSLTGAVDTGSDGTGVSIAADTTTVNVVVPESLTFTNSPTSITLTPTPDVADFANTTLSVQTNAGGGYSVTGCGTALTGTGTHNSTDSIPEMTSGASIAPTNSSGYGSSGFGVEVSAVTGTGTKGTNYASQYDGLPACTSSPATLFGNTAPTNLDTATISNGAYISGSQAAGTYQGTLFYQITPNY